MANLYDRLGALRVLAVLVAVAGVLVAAVALGRRGDVARTFPEPLTSPSYFDDFYADPATRPANLVAGDRVRAATRNARR